MTVEDVLNLLAWAWPWIATILVTFLALVTSIHAILTKRDPRSTIAWVGFVWLVPVLGAALYGIFGINRMRRSAQRLRLNFIRYGRAPALEEAPAGALARLLPDDQSSLRALVAVVDRVTERRLVAGNSLWPLRDGEEAYPEMLAAIAAAERSISLSTYLFDNDPLGRRFAAALAAAMARGVSVRVLIDDLGARYTYPPITRVLRDAGVRVATFLPILLPERISFVNLRSHRKILVVDGKVGFTGGMNLREGHLARTAGKGAIQDLHFRVEGPVVAHLQAVFAEDWHFATAEALGGERWFPRLSPCGGVIARGIVDGPDESGDNLHWTLLAALACARRRVAIMTPYFLPDQSLIGALNVTAMRGVTVDILLPRENNLPFVQWAMFAHVAELLEHGCRVWLTAPPFDHTKLMVVDDYWTLLGSSNWDPRALRLNFEMNVECYDGPLAQRLVVLIDEKQRGARPLTLAEVEGRGNLRKLRDGVASLFTPYL